MSYVNPSQPTKPPRKPLSPTAKRGGGGALFLMMLIVGFFILMSNTNQIPGDQNSTPEKKSGIKRGNVEGVLGRDGSVGRDMPSTGANRSADGWSIDTDANENTDSDWQIDTDAGKKDDSTGLRLNDANDRSNDTDWEIDDDVGKKNDSTDDDWQIDDVDR